MTVEKNDVDISRLFVWGKVYSIQDAEGKEEAKVYMRLLGDADVNRARVYALRKSAELRRKLKDPNSDERIIYIREIDDISKEELINYVVMFSMRDITNSAYKEIKIPKPKPPKSDAKLEKMEAYQKEVDDYPKKIEQALHKYIQTETTKLKKSLEGESKEVLHNKYINQLIGEFCEQEAFKAYKEMELYLGCYRDSDYKEKFFNSFEEYDNLDSQMKIDFRTAYEKLDIPMDELKKLREATL